MEDKKEYYLCFLEKSRKKIRSGDVFVVKVHQLDLYFYGKVIEEQIEFCNAKLKLVFLYKTPTTEIIVPDDMDENDVMTALLVSTEGWRVGLYKTICNIPVKDEELNVDYGFESPAHGGWINKEEVEKYSKNHEILNLNDGRILTVAYVDAYGNVRDHFPKIISRYALSLPPAISYEISKYLHNNPDVKKKYGLE